MSDQIMAFTPGTLVWVKINNRLWWPGRVVNPTTAPQLLQDVMRSKRNPIAMVFFESNNTYDVVINKEKIAFYCCAKKNEFLNKGYSFLVEEKKRAKIPSGVQMGNFVKDVIKFEEEINGDVNIFKRLRKKNKRHPPQKICTKNDNLVLSNPSTDDEDEQQLNEEFITMIINGDKTTDLDGITADQLPAESINPENQTSVLDINLVNHHSNIEVINISAVQLGDEIVIEQQFVSLPSTFPMPDDEEDIKNWNRNPKAAGNLDNWSPTLMQKIKSSKSLYCKST